MSPRPEPPRDVEALLARAHALAGRTLGELAAEHGRALPARLVHGKGLFGQLVEAALGAHGGSRAEPDFPGLGVELKTVPMAADGRVLESTFVATVPLTALPSLEFAASPIGHKLADVLFVPVEGRDVPLPMRRIGAAVRFRPTDIERRVFESDYAMFSEAVTRGALSGLRADVGEALQLRPKGQKGGDRRLATDEDGFVRLEQPRGVYLRARFVEAALRARRT